MAVRVCFLGADTNGRDIMVRLLYGGRNSLWIGVLAAVFTVVFSVVVGIVAGFYRGWTDSVIARVLDIIWAFPVVLLGVALGTALALGGLKLGPITVGRLPLDPDSRDRGGVHPVHGPAHPREVLALREREFVEAARAQGAGPLRLMFSEILPDLPPRSWSSSH